jgi:DNA-binding transcriptional LysR family regulator
MATGGGPVLRGHNAGPRRRAEPSLPYPSMNWRPDLQTLRLFVAVCEENSFSRAAEREATVVSAVSKRISDFEQASGTQLLRRSAKGIEATDAGVAALARARQILAATELLQEDLKAFTQGERGHVRLLAAASAGAQGFAADLADFLQAHPQVSVTIEERMAEAIIEGVRAGEADLGLGFASASAFDLHQAPYGPNSLAVFAAPGHPLFQKERIGLADLLDVDLVALSESSGTTRLLSSLAARESRTLRYRAFTSTLEAAFRIVATGSCVAVLGEHAGPALQQWYGVKPIPLAEAWARRELVFYTREREPSPPPTRRLLAHFLRRHAQRQAA